MITLNETAIALIRDSKLLKKALLKEMGTTERMLYLDLAKNHVKLTQIRFINIIVEHTNRPLSELITGGVASKLLGM